MKITKSIAMLLSAAMLLGAAGCSSTDTEAGGTETNGVAKEEIKVGVIHIGDPADGSGYSYTHDLGITGMQENLGLEDSQIIRKINIPDSDTAATKTAIEECIAEGCHIIFGTSYG